MDDINLGTISGKIDMDTSALEKRVDEVMQLWENIQQGATEAAAGFTTGMVDGLYQYQWQLDLVAEKLERQRNLILDLEEISSSQPTESNSSAEIENAAVQLENERNKLRDLQKQFDDTYAAMSKFIAQQEKAAKAAEGAKAGTEAAASGLKSFDQTFPSIIDNIGNVISLVLDFKELMSALGSSAASGGWATGIVAAVGVAGMLVSAGMRQMKADEEARQRAFEEGVQKTQEYSGQLLTLEKNIRIMQDEKSTIDDVKNARQALTDTFPELIVGYTDEGEAILANNDALEKYIESLKVKQELARRDIIKNGGDTLNDPQDLKWQIDTLNERIAEYKEQYQKAVDAGGVYYDDIKGYGYKVPHYAEQTGKLISSLESDLEQLNLEYQDSIPGVEEYFTAQLQGAIKIADSNGNLVLSWQDMSRAQQMAFNDFKSNGDHLEEYITGGEDALKSMAEQIQEILNSPDLLEDYLAQFDNIPQIQISDISGEISQLESLASAYQALSEGRQLDAGQMYELINLYPELAQFIASTGDLTFQNGEILRDFFETKKQGTLQTLENDLAVAESQRSMAQSNITQIQAEIGALQTLMTARLAALGPNSMQYVTEDSENRQKLDDLNRQLDQRRKELVDSRKAIDQAAASIEVIKSSSLNTGTSSGSSGGSSSGGGSSRAASSAPSRNEALQQELKLLQQQKKMDQLTSQQEYDWLVRLQGSYSMNADERMDLEYRIYAAKKKLEEEQEKAASDRLKEEYKAISNKKNMDALSAKEELAWLQKIQKTFRMNAEERMDLEIKIFNLKKQLREDDIDSLNTIGDAVTEALKKQYEKQKENEEKRIDDSIDGWKKWEEETCAAIQGQIDALDELEKEQDSAEKRREYENKRQAAELLLKYEKDDYQRKQIQMQINQLDAEEQKRLEEEAREAERSRLEAELDRIKETSSKQQEALEDQKDALSDRYNELLKDFNLRAQAEKAIMNSTQQEILNLIKSYAPEYDLAGQSIGEKLVDGFKSKVGDIENYLNSLTKKLSDYQANLAYTANQAADQFWASRKQYEQQLAGYAVSKNTTPPSNVIQMTVQFNQPVESPIEVRRQMDKVAENLARQLGG